MGYLALRDLVWSLPLSLALFPSTLGLLHSTVATLDSSYFFNMLSIFFSCALTMLSSQNTAPWLFPWLTPSTHSGLCSAVLPRGCSLTITCSDHLHLPLHYSSLLCALLQFSLLHLSVTDMALVTYLCAYYLFLLPECKLCEGMIFV